MAKQEQGADKTEKPTPKRLRDARKDGDVAKSKELTSTVLVLCWLVMAWLAVPMVARQLLQLFQGSLDAIGPGMDVSREQMLPLGLQAFKTLLLVTLPLTFGAAAIGVLTEFLQVGVVFAPKDRKSVV